MDISTSTIIQNSSVETEIDSHNQDIQSSTSTSAGKSFYLELAKKNYIASFLHILEQLWKGGSIPNQFEGVKNSCLVLFLTYIQQHITSDLARGLQKCIRSLDLKCKTLSGQRARTQHQEREERWFWKKRFTKSRDFWCWSLITSTEKSRLTFWIASNGFGLSLFHGQGEDCISYLQICKNKVVCTYIGSRYIFSSSLISVWKHLIVNTLKPWYNELR